MSTTLTASPIDTIMAVDLASVPVVCTDRHIPRKEQAALARKLFRQLGIKGVSVTAPNYSMAHSVDVRIPQEPHPGWDGFEQYQHESYSDMLEDVPAKVRHLRHCEAVRQVEAILDAAFPSHVDRSDLQSDHFNFCWTVG